MCLDRTTCAPLLLLVLIITAIVFPSSIAVFASLRVCNVVCNGWVLIYRSEIILVTLVLN